jgi:hypothetical protein
MLRNDAFSLIVASCGRNAGYGPHPHDKPTVQARPATSEQLTTACEADLLHDRRDLRRGIPYRHDWDALLGRCGGLLG